MDRVETVSYDPICPVFRTAGDRHEEPPSLCDLLFPALATGVALGSEPSLEQLRQRCERHGR